VARRTFMAQLLGLPFLPWFAKPEESKKPLKIMMRSASVTPRAREQAPQAKTGMCFATTFSRVSLSGGQPTGVIALTVALRIK
jgi:hypothetical protein